MGIRVIELGLGALHGFDLRRAAFPYMQQLVERFDETCDEEGIRAVSTPIRDIDGSVIAALSVPGPTNRMPPQRMREIVDALVEACNAISAHVLRT